MDGCRGVLAVVVAVALGMATIAAPASAAIVGTEQMLSPSAARNQVEAFIARADVQQKLQDWGIDPADAQRRVAALTESELQGLAARIDELPAGAGALEVIGVVFLVLLILELVGVINVFTAI
ncbi:PA2779 family protein [Sinimarinibacterium thermocellulolyticum]|uniref:PA2779 family protein n=1 Tax=Sinimarinibacterium thermocellulolyticum TaxID=3170016 RepID=A0ABV2AB64_9GAMM